ncbi:Exoribonuclease II, mitochondrial [Candida viswanathii]|uniref:Exoribonuclease II, mitochondrial n=1 Tax=Candida viswanathii TaxID=5486 RepID=A0A367XNP9_9ASCO|nr:Exoribonuclease II, mitochondrial [Candida viswanathii]
MLRTRPIPKKGGLLILQNRFSLSPTINREAFPKQKARPIKHDRTDFKQSRKPKQNRQPERTYPKDEKSTTGYDDGFFEDLFSMKPKKRKLSAPSEGLADLRKMLQSKPKFTEYSDPSNVKLDLDLPNSVLAKDIRSRAEKSNTERYGTPSEQWRSKFSETELKELADFFEQLSYSATVSGVSMDKPINVGDIVTLGTDSLRLYVVVSTPKSFNSTICTLLSDRGEILFASFFTVGYRFSGVIPEKYHHMLESFVVLEKKYLDVPPVGVPDARFSKSNDALPEELQGDKSGEITEENEGEDSGYDPNDLLVQQASSQLLTNTNVRTFIVPLSARNMYKQALLDISNTSYGKLGSMNFALEDLHKRLQSTELGASVASRTFSIFEILARLHNPGMKDESDPKLGLSIDKVEEYENKQFKITDILALLTLLRKQSHLWTVIPAKSSFTPTKVRMLSLIEGSEHDGAWAELVFKDGLDHIPAHLKANSQNKECRLPRFDQMSAMLRGYINGKFQDDNSMSTLVVSAIRKLNKLLADLGKPVEDLYKNGYSSGRAYDILTTLNKGVNFNPLMWSSELTLANKAPSVDAYVCQKYYEHVDTTQEDSLSNQTDEANFYSTDPLQELRVDMKETPVYCIDDPTAHEIDDGISIEQDGNEYVVSIHVAEPSSYLKPESPISSIAFEKASTIYFPEEAFPMLPKSVSNKAGLGVAANDTRSFVVQYRLEKALVDEFINSKLKDENYIPSEELLKTVEKQIYSNNKILFATVRNFREGFTYDKVNEVLANVSRREQYREQGKSDDSDFDNLIKLEHVSTLLSSIRKLYGMSMEFLNTMSVRVEKSETIHKESTFERTADGKLKVRLANSNDVICIAPALAGGKSTQLVTQNMIIANHLTAKFAIDNDIKILYRYADPNFNAELKKEYNDLSKEGESVSIEKWMQLFAFFTRASITDTPHKHFLMGLSLYSNITSPLRRYIDLFNQWKIQDYFLGCKRVPDLNVSGIASYLDGQSKIIRGQQRKSVSFWEGLFLRTYRDQVHAGKVSEPIDFKLQLIYNPVNSKSATVNAFLDNLISVIPRVEVSSELLQDVESGKLKVGEVIPADRVRLKQVDFVEDEIIFEYK